VNKHIFYLGLLLFLLGLWGGSYLLSLFHDTWAGFPILMTSFIIGAMGAAGMGMGIATKEKNHE
jgi:hypothetical protein